MRELEATKFVLDKALLKAREVNARQIKRLHILLGEISELDQNLIRKHWVEMSKGTLLENTPLHFRRMPAEVQCMSCFQKYYPENGKIHCPHCGSMGAKILSGEEFQIESIEIDDE